MEGQRRPRGRQTRINLETKGKYGKTGTGWRDK